MSAVTWTSIGPSAVKIMDVTRESLPIPPSVCVTSRAEVAKHHPPQIPIILNFSASDPTAGAGLQADLLTQAALGVYGVTVVTALTVQDTSGVLSVHPVSGTVVQAQAEAILRDMPVAAFKVGLTGSAENIDVIASIIAAWPNIPVVVDPVLASGRGDALSDDGMIRTLRARLLPQTTVLTPNSLEARRLAAQQADEVYDLDLPSCAERLISAGCRYVLVTGTHDGTPQVANSLYGAEGRISRSLWPRLPGSYHGSGCTLASALAARLACGATLEQAVEEAQEFTWGTLNQGLAPSYHGRGQLLPDRFYWLRNSDGASAVTHQLSSPISGPISGPIPGPQAIVTDLAVPSPTLQQQRTRKKPPAPSSSAPPSDIAEPTGTVPCVAEPTLPSATPAPQFPVNTEESFQALPPLSALPPVESPPSPQEEAGSETDLTEENPMRSAPRRSRGRGRTHLGTRRGGRKTGGEPHGDSPEMLLEPVTEIQNS